MRTCKDRIRKVSFPDSNVHKLILRHFILNPALRLQQLNQIFRIVCNLAAWANYLALGTAPLGIPVRHGLRVEQAPGQAAEFGSGHDSQG